MSSGFRECDGEAVFLGVELRDAAQWNRPLSIDVSDRDSRQTRHTQRSGDFGEQVVECTSAAAGIFGAFHAFAEYDRAAAVERAGQLELVHHAIDAIDGLVDVFQD